MNALKWLLMHDENLSEAATNYGIDADTSDEELEGKAWMAERVAYDEGFNVDGDVLLSIFTEARETVRRSLATLGPDDPLSPPTA